mmetsp:Transcript_8485/g.11208  ORF Transcript_8485/g.11208 Transcript_8485/m.11208 type:complete len:116 (+) Transcript_8485:109-456(+)
MGLHEFPQDPPPSEEEIARLILELAREADLNDETKKKKLSQTIKSHTKMFMREGECIAPRVRTRHKIELLEDRIFRVTPRQLLESKRLVIRKSELPWAAATVLVPNPDWYMALLY